MLHPSLSYLAHGRLGGSSCALMLHYSNWLIGVKNRASLRNASKTPPSPDCNNRGNTVAVQNNNPLPSEKTAAFAVTNHLLQKGKSVQRPQWWNTASLKCQGPQKIIYPFISIPPLYGICTVLMHHKCSNNVSSRFGCAKVKLAASSAASSSGQRGGRRRAPLPRRRSAKGLASCLEALG